MVKGEEVLASKSDVEGKLLVAPSAPEVGGPDQVRTDDLLNAIEALCQLSYEPVTN